MQCPSCKRWMKSIHSEEGIIAWVCDRSECNIGTINLERPHKIKDGSVEFFTYSMGRTMELQKRMQATTIAPSEELKQRKPGPPLR